MKTTLPSYVKKVIHDYIYLISNHLPNRIEGIYLYGSIALNAYIEKSSDIDFISVVNSPLNKKEIDILSEVHQKILHLHPESDMMGSYLQWNDLGKNENEFEACPYYYEGKMHEVGIFDINPVTWWVMKRHGVNLLGPHPHSLPFEVHNKDLLDYVLQNMNTYWADRIQHIENMDISNLSDHVANEEVEWSVLGTLHQYYTLKEKDVTSKIAAGEYGLHHLPETWHRVIKEALNIRKGVKESYFPSNGEKMKEVLKFLKFISKQCNQLAHQ